MDTADVYDKQTFIEHEAFYKDSTIFLLSMLMACGYAMKIHEVQKDTMLSSLYKDAKAIMATIFIPKNAYIHALNMQIYYAIKNKENDMTNPTAQDDLEFVYHDFNIIESSYRDNSALHLQFPLDSKLCDTCFNDMNNTDSKRSQIPVRLQNIFPLSAPGHSGPVPCTALFRSALSEGFP